MKFTSGQNDFWLIEADFRDCLSLRYAEDNDDQSSLRTSLRMQILDPASQSQ